MSYPTPTENLQYLFNPCLSLGGVCSITLLYKWLCYFFLEGVALIPSTLYLPNNNEIQWGSFMIPPFDPILHPNLTEVEVEVRFAGQLNARGFEELAKSCPHLQARWLGAGKGHEKIQPIWSTERYVFTVVYTYRSWWLHTFHKCWLPDTRWKRFFCSYHLSRKVFQQPDAVHTISSASSRSARWFISRCGTILLATTAPKQRRGEKGMEGMQHVDGWEELRMWSWMFLLSTWLQRCV